MTTPGPPIRRSTSAFSLPEVVAALSLVALALGLVLPAGRGLQDRWAVVSARDQALALAREARVRARLAGGAHLEVDVDSVLLRLVVGDAPSACLCDLARTGVELEIPGGATRATLRWNALGLGVVASRTLVFRRGGAEARLVISSRGRAVRR